MLASLRAPAALALAKLALLLAAAGCAAMEAEPPAAAAPPNTLALDPNVAEPVPATAPRIASYALRARLDADTHTIQGEGTITWVNASSVAVDELYFHLYLNAFENEKTLFYRSPFRRSRGGEAPERWGSIRIERLRARELAGADLLPGLAPHSPDDPLDTTDRRVQLPGPVPPGSALTLDVGWTSVLPELRDRTGFSGDFHFVAQWFPKLARLEPNGVWAHFPFHPHAEFYADFGAYDVTLDVPEGARVGASGRRVSATRSQGRLRLRYRADGVHDFAWTAWPHFRERTAHMSGIDVHLLYPPGHDRNADLTLETLRRALPHYAARYGSYPYPDLTVVHPPDFAPQAGGMEYPTLITTGGAWHQSFWSRSLENVVIHELGHQWFYGMLASDERRWPFLDEGLNSYAESVAMHELYGAGSASASFGIELDSEALRRALMLQRPQDLPIALPAAEFASFQDLGAIVYGRTALLFQTIAHVYGEEKVANGLRRYALDQRFRHPTPDDLLNALAGTLGESALANLRGALLEGHGVDYAVTALASAPAPEQKHLVESQVVVHRAGELRFPVEVLLTTGNGERITKTWDGNQRMEVISHVGPSPVVSAVLDPRNRIAIDENLLNNARSHAPRPPSITRERTVYGLELLVGLLAP